MPPDGDLAGLVDRAAAHQGRTIRVVPIPMPSGGPSGLWLRQGDTDLVVVDQEAPPSRRAAIVCHELGHMLLGHDGPGESLNATMALVAPDIDPDVRRRFLAAREGYSEDLECAAERVATSLAGELLRRARHPRWSGDRVSSRLR